MIVYPPCPVSGSTGGAMSGRKSGGGHQAKRRLVQWKETNVEQGIVRVDEALLTRLIKKEPIHKYYRIDPEPLSTGMFSEVRRCRSIETGQVYAAKFSCRLRYGEDSTKEIHHEIALLSLASPSPRIVKLHDVFQTKEKFIIIMEFAPGGDMQTIIDDNLVPYESDVVKYVQQVVEGLAYLHQRKIAHLDIKPQNLVMMGEFPNCDIKVCDFEISRVILEGSEIHEILGTPEYVAPEILHYEPITLAADMWSLGVTAYALLTGFSPFGGETDQETFLNISRALVDFPDELFEDISPEAKDFVAKLLKRKPSERMSAKECLKHPWLTKHRKAAKVSQQCKQDCILPTGEPRRVGCSSCPPSAHGLRNYLSKSREALFEKVVSQQRQLEKQKDSSLRRSTLLQQVNKTRRLCESQMSLVSKSREKLIAEQHAHLTRSREKLYGLRSLSKSHEVLNLYKSLVNLHQDDDKPLPGILKDLSDQVQNSNDDLSSASLASSVVSIVDEYKRMMDKEVMKNDVNGNQETKNNNIHHENGNEVIEEEKSNVMFHSNGSYEDKERPVLQVTVTEPNIEGPLSPEVSNSDTLSLTEFNSTTDSDISEEDSCSTGREASTEEDEPRFTVKQLISAYNKHQEIVTKTSLEVTMSSDSPKEKMAPVLETTGSHKFPTGPNALRLFIPDIKITSRKKRMPRKKTGLRPPASFEIQEECSDESISGSKTDLSAVNARLNEIITLPETKTELSRLVDSPKFSRSSSNSSIASKSSDHSTTSRVPDFSTKNPTSVAKTVELFNNVISSTHRPDRKSFSTTHSPPTLESEKTRRKSSPPTSKPVF